MKFTSFFLFILLLSCQTEIKEVELSTATEENIEEVIESIKEVMSAQEIAWNKHDLEGFMDGYWRDENLKFYGSNGLTKGWNNTLAVFKKAYPTKAESGILRFVIIDISIIEKGNYWVMGEFHNTGPAVDQNGVFMIVFKKINGEWKIVADMSC